MPPGAQEAIQAAAGRGYEAVVIVIVMIAMLIFFGALGKWFISSTDSRLAESSKREERLAARISTLEAFVENTLMSLVGNVSKLMAESVEATRALSTAMGQLPCLLDEDREETARHTANSLDIVAEHAAAALQRVAAHAAEALKVRSEHTPQPIQG